jgi:hypothetical protein
MAMDISPNSIPLFFTDKRWKNKKTSHQAAHAESQCSFVNVYNNNVLRNCDMYKSSSHFHIATACVWLSAFFETVSDIVLPLLIVCAVDLRSIYKCSLNVHEGSEQCLPDINSSFPST